MATAWNDDRLTWIVPARRVVVRKKLKYSEAAEAWKDQLDHYKDALKRWYGASGAFTFDAALAAVKSWIDTFFGTPAAPVDAARAGDNTVVLTKEGFFPRLWKGPLRVAHEEAKTAIDDAPTLDAKKTVTNPDAVLRMGDVLEWPLHAFLLKCGKADYASAAFDPKGSFYLGTTVTGADPATAPLHDNLLAMRMQQLLALGRGAFCATKAVFVGTSRTWTGPHGKDDKLEVWARGMVYGAELRAPKSDRKNYTRWEVEDYYWGHWGNPDKKAWETWGKRHNEACAPVLYVEDYAMRLAPDQPLTPGWTCSPFTLFMSNYILGDVEGVQYHGGVQPTMGFKGTFPLTTHFELVKAPALLRNAGVQATVKKATDGVDALRVRITDAIALLSSAKGQDAPAVAALPEPARKFLAKPIAADKEKTDPAAILAAAVELVEHKKKATPELDDAQKEVVQTFHRDWIAAFPAGDGAAISKDSTWVAIDTGGPSFATKDWPKECPADGCTGKHNLAPVKSALASLGKSLASLQPIDPKKDPENYFGGRKWQSMDWNEHVTDINVSVLDGHEYAYVRFRAFDEITTETDLPRAGQLGGYDPLTGDAYVASGTAPKGQLYVMDASGFLHQWTGEVQCMTPRPWICAPVTNNRIMLRYFSDYDRHRVAIGEWSPAHGGLGMRGHKPWEGFVQLKNEADKGTQYLHSKAWADLTWKPFQLIEKSAEVPGRETQYAERAVPFPTLAEVATVYPSVNQALAVAQSIVDQLREYATIKEAKAAEAKAKADQEKADRDAAAAWGLPPPPTPPPVKPAPMAEWEKSINALTPDALRKLADAIVNGHGPNTGTHAAPAATPAPAAPGGTPTPAAPGPTASPTPGLAPLGGPASRPIVP